MSILLVDDLEWHSIADKELRPDVGKECYIKIYKKDDDGNKIPVSDIFRVTVRWYDQEVNPSLGDRVFWRDGVFKRNAWFMKDVDAWADIPAGDPTVKQLLPCPFCGGKATLHHEEAYEDDYGDMPEHWWIGCDNSIVGRKTCHMLVQTGLFLSKEKAIDAWNTRKG